MTTLEKLMFMKDYAETRKSQSNDGNRNPVFWLIQDEVLEPCNPDECSDETDVLIIGKYIEPKYYSTSEWYQLRDAILNDIKDNFDFENHDITICAEMDEFKEYITNALNLNNIVEAIETNTIATDIMKYHYEIHHFKKEYRIVYDHVFLTKEAAKEHIKNYHYRYKNPRTYANTCSDSPFMETFFKIIDEPGFWDEMINMLKDNNNQ